MSRAPFHRTSLVIPLVLAVFAGCQDTVTTAPKLGLSVPLAQGVGGIWTVNSLADPGDGTCDDTNCTLREAINAALPGDDIMFATGLQGSILLTSELLIDAHLGIHGDGRITLDGQDNTPLVRSAFTNQTPPPTFVTLEGLVLTNGRFGNGGGVFVGASTYVSIFNSTIFNSDAAGSGGGIVVQAAGSLTLTNSLVYGNVAAGDGGGVFNAGTLVINGITVASNRASDGGAISNSAGATATVNQTTISGNNGNAGGIRNYGSLQVVSSTVAGNNGGIVNGAAPSVATVRNSIVAGNGNIECDGGNVNSLGYNLTTNNSAAITVSVAPGSSGKKG